MSDIATYQIPQEVESPEEKEVEIPIQPNEFFSEEDVKGEHESEEEEHESEEEEHESEEEEHESEEEELDFSEEEESDVDDRRDENDELYPWWDKNQEYNTDYHEIFKTVAYSRWITLIIDLDVITMEHQGKLTALRTLFSSRTACQISHVLNGITNHDDKDDIINCIEYLISALEHIDETLYSNNSIWAIAIWRYCKRKGLGAYAKSLVTNGIIDPSTVKDRADEQNERNKLRQDGINLAWQSFKKEISQSNKLAQEKRRKKVSPPKVEDEEYEDEELEVSEDEEVHEE